MKINKLLIKTSRKKAGLSRMKKCIKNTEKLLKSKDISEAINKFKLTQSLIMKGAHKGYISKNSSSRRIANLSKKINIFTI